MARRGRGRTGRWSHRFVAVGVGFLLAWQAVRVGGGPRRSAVILAVLGFVLHVVFGMSYVLVPAAFRRVHPPSDLPGVHLALTTSGTALLALAGARVVPGGAATLGAVLWGGGVVAFLGSLARAVGEGLSPAVLAAVAEDASPAERVALATLPVPYLYLALGSYDLLAVHAPLPALVAASPARVTHLFAAGVAALLVFALSVRLLPRFLGTDPSLALAAVVLPTGAVGPALLASSLWGGRLFRLAAAVEATAVVGFACHCALLVRRAERRPTSLYGVLAGAVAGVGAVGVGLGVALDLLPAALVGTHAALNLVGFLGLTVVGFGLQFYPPTTGGFEAGDRAATASMACLGGGLLVEVCGRLAAVDTLVTGGRALAAFGAAVYAALVVRVLVTLRSR